MSRIPHIIAPARTFRFPAHLCYLPAQSGRYACEGDDRQENMKQLSGKLKRHVGGYGLAVGMGITAYILHTVTPSSITDPLVIALILGILARTVIPFHSDLRGAFTAAPRIFIPVGIVLYAVKNLNFIRYGQVEFKTTLLLLVIIAVYIGVILVLGKVLRQKTEITCLTATGSAICGASAIAITAPAVEGESDDVSISLLSVVVAAFIGLFIALPFIAATLNMTSEMYGFFSGSVLQMTGFVKSAASNPPFLTETLSPAQAVKYAMSIKAVRYLGLLAALPLLASITRRKVYLPWVLWLFLGAGIAGTLLCARYPVFYAERMIPVINPCYQILWSVAMAALGLNADARLLLSNQGAKAIVMAMAGMTAAILTFFVGLYWISGGYIG